MEEGNARVRGSSARTTGATRCGRVAEPSVNAALLPHLFASPNNAIYCVVHDGDVYIHTARVLSYTHARREHGRTHACPRGRTRRGTEIDGRRGGRGIRRTAVGRSAGQTDRRRARYAGNSARGTLGTHTIRDAGSAREKGARRTCRGRGKGTRRVLSVPNSQRDRIQRDERERSLRLS